MVLSKEEMINILQKYNTITFYKEIRDKNNELVFFHGASFDSVGLDEDGFIIFQNQKTQEECLININLLKVSIVPISPQRDRLIVEKEDFNISFFCKK